MDIAIVVLAAGESKRFGSFKLLADFCGEPIVVRAVATATSTGLPVYVVLGHMAGEVRRALSERGLGVGFIYNLWYREGISSSLKAAVTALPRFHGYIIALGDMPLVSRRTYEALIDNADRAPIVYPTYRGVRGNPVYISRAVLPYIMELRGDVGVRALMGRIKSAGVEVDDPGVLIDIDERKDIRPCL
ncbi:MAG: nucleotidyltransferase family protein [Pyrobaculum sp.]